MVVFTSNATLKINVKSKVLYTDQLLQEIRKYNEKIISIKKMNEIYNLLLKINIGDNDVRKEHVKEIRKNVSDYNDKINNNICPKCNGKLVLRKGKYGSFYGCSNYPKCRYTKKQ